MDGWAGVDWTPDGKIVFSSAANGHPDIWITDEDGNNQKQLTVNLGSNFNGLSVSPDGRYIVYVSARSGGPHIWRVDLDGGNPKQLTDGTGEFNPFFSADGQWVFYRYGVADKSGIWKVPVDGGSPAQLPDPLSHMTPHGISPHGEMAACTLPGSQATGRVLGIFSVENGSLIQQIPISRRAAPWVEWTPDGRFLTYIEPRAGVANLWIQPLDGGPAKQLTDFKADYVYQFAWSRDGRRLVCGHGSTSNDVVLISGIR
jgi:Tol biopolymer transport system component